MLQENSFLKTLLQISYCFLNEVMYKPDRTAGTFMDCVAANSGSRPLGGTIARGDFRHLRRKSRSYTILLPI